MSIDDQQIGRVLEDGGIAIQERFGPGDGGIDAIGDLLNVEEGRNSGRGLSAREIGTENGLLHKCGAGPACAQGPLEETASRIVCHFES